MDSLCYNQNGDKKGEVNKSDISETVIPLMVTKHVDIYKSLFILKITTIPKELLSQPANSLVGRYLKRRHFHGIHKI